MPYPAVKIAPDKNCISKPLSPSASSATFCMPRRRRAPACAGGGSPARRGAVDSRWLAKRNKGMELPDVKGYDPALIEDTVHCGEEYITYKIFNSRHWYSCIKSYRCTIHR